ncbi:hypothetical protein OWV82_007806 [Melia azedarach]|uniref:Uncharacterized protein n=1 Tax=Melia azedarach TaxID=155640 RepID=A0ACC1Y9E7_MELAZ|nr:hypothetical protein OWV82_007806 [Melia azedarach]
MYRQSHFHHLIHQSECITKPLCNAKIPNRSLLKKMAAWGSLAMVDANGMLVEPKKPWLRLSGREVARGRGGWCRCRQ